MKSSLTIPKGFNYSYEETIKRLDDLILEIYDFLNQNNYFDNFSSMINSEQKIIQQCINDFDNKTNQKANEIAPIIGYRFRNAEFKDYTKPMLARLKLCQIRALNEIRAEIITFISDEKSERLVSANNKLARATANITFWGVIISILSGCFFGYLGILNYKNSQKFERKVYCVIQNSKSSASDQGHKSISHVENSAKIVAKPTKVIQVPQMLDKSK